MTLITFIDLHAEGYYISHSEGESLIRQRIGETILNDIMKNNMNGIGPTRIPWLFLLQFFSNNNRKLSFN